MAGGIRAFSHPVLCVGVEVMAEKALAESYRTCSRMQRRHDPTFYLATRFLPGAVRPGVHAVYGYVRHADDIVDDPRPEAGPRARRDALDAWEAALQRALDGEPAEHPIVAALVDTGRRHDLPLGLLKRYLESMRLDCAPVRMASDAALDDYMEGSAATVGRIMAPLLGTPPGAHESLAQLGVAFQLANFVRDVPIDWKLDRIYLPGLDEADLRAGRAGARTRNHVARHVARARRLFADSAGVEALLAPSMRTGVRLARGIYGRVLDRVERNGFDVLGRRARLAPWEAPGAVAGALMGGR